jgi:antitoxin CptB
LSAGGQVAWRCRRGTKELDVLLERYVQRDYPQAGAAERAAFSRILDLPDPLLTDYLFGHVAPEEPAIAELVERIATHRD